MTGDDPGPIPDFLRMSAEQRETAWRHYAARRPKGETDVKPGPKEEQLRALKAERTAAPAPARAETKQEKPMKTITLAPVKALEAPLGETGAAPRPATPAKPKKAAPTKKAASKKKPPAKTAPAKKAASPKKATDGAKEIRPGSKLETIGKLLRRPQGCTSKQVLDATGWPSVSMPQQAAALGVKLKKEKVDGVNIYRAA